MSFFELLTKKPANKGAFVSKVLNHIQQAEIQLYIFIYKLNIFT